MNSNGSVAKTNNNKKEKIVQSKTLGTLCGLPSVCDIRPSMNSIEHHSPDPNATKQYTFGYMNTQSLRGKLEDCLPILNDFHFFTFSETNFDESVADQEYLVKDFECFRFDSTVKTRGVLTFCKTLLLPTLNDEVQLLLSKSTFLYGSALFINPPKSRKFTVVSLYIPPNQTKAWLEHFESLLELLSNQHLEFVIFGDINCSIAGTTISQHEPAYNSLIRRYNLQHYVNSPTRRAIYGNKTTQTCLDHIISHNVSPDQDGISTNQEPLVAESAQFNGVADHDGILFKVNCTKNLHDNASKTKFRHSKRFYSPEKLLELLTAVNWEMYNRNSNSESSVDQQYNSFIKEVSRVFNTLCPLTEVKTPTKAQNKHPWYTPEITRRKRKQKRLHKLARTEAAYRELYKEFKQKTIQMINEEKAKLLKISTDSNNAKEGWKLLKNMVPGFKTKSNIVPHGLSPNEINHHYSNVAKKNTRRFKRGHQFTISDHKNGEPSRVLFHKSTYPARSY
jgi:hypothetical protein